MRPVLGLGLLLLACGGEGFVNNPDPLAVAGSGGRPGSAQGGAAGKAGSAAGGSSQGAAAGSASEGGNAPVAGAGGDPQGGASSAGSSAGGSGGTATAGSSSSAGSTGTAGSGGNPRACDSLPSANVVITCNHPAAPHSLVVTREEINAGETKHYTLESVGHTHAITLYPAEFETIREGGAVQLFLEGGTYSDHCVIISCGATPAPDPDVCGTASACL